MDDDQKSINVFVSSDELLQVKALAKLDNRTMKHWIHQLIKKALKNAPPLNLVKEKRRD